MKEPRIHNFWYSSFWKDCSSLVKKKNKNFSSWLSTVFNSLSIIMNSTYATISESNITAYVNNSFTFFKSAYYVQFLFDTVCLSPVFHLDCIMM